MEIAQFGCFDVGNYGDLVLPHIARHRLVGHRVMAMAPVGGGIPRWPDAAAAARADGALQEGFRCDACLIGGGSIIRTDAAGIPTYGQDGQTAGFALPSLWLGAGLVAGRAGAHLIWNAPAVPGPIADPRTQALVAALLAASDYVSVSDAASRSYLLDCAKEAPAIAVVPDTIVDIALLWPRGSLLPQFEALAVRSGWRRPARSIAFHLRDLPQQPVADIAGQVTRMAGALDCVPILLSGDTAGDDGALARAVAASLAVPHLLVDRPSSLRETAACLAFADFYVGSDRHGFLTSFAYGNRGLLVDAAAPSWLTAILPADLIPVVTCADWAQAPDALQGVAARAVMPWAVSLEAARRALDAHWDQVAACLAAPASDYAARRHEFIRAVAADNGRSSGWTGQLAGVMAREAARSTPSPVVDLLDLPFLVIQGPPGHAKRQGKHLVIHPPASGRTEISLDPIHLCGGDVISGAVTVAHAEGNPVLFDLLLIGRDGSMLAAAQVVAEAGQLARWQMSVPAGFDGAGILLAATSMAVPGSSTRYAWAVLAEAGLDPAGLVARSRKRQNGEAASGPG